MRLPARSGSGGSASILAGSIFDDRGNRMSSTHSNKLGVRYRYYVSHALLQNLKQEAGSVARVPAPEIERLVLDGVRPHLLLTELSISAPDRDLIEREGLCYRQLRGRVRSNLV
jgi:site-specific DNA recombinase